MCAGISSSKKVSESGYSPRLDKSQDLVQIKAGAKEVRLITIIVLSLAMSQLNTQIERRILSFIERKREQVNLSNIHDFCYRDNVQVEASCARVNAVLLCRKDSKSHLRVRRVLNQWGPQTRGVDPGSVSDPRDPALIHNQPQEGMVVKKEPPGVAVGIEERLRNVETHLTVKGPVPSDIYARLKQIEDRILYLESVSPEYFQLYCYTTADIDNKLQELEFKLTQKRKT
uniref:Uncharacterized protein n=1 Tax=Timema bartmani TaxID=61472 RepID=A0A7R9F6P6_9NEOP|nr:unnamed protein product [Timema bartmani]